MSILFLKSFIVGNTDSVWKNYYSVDECSMRPIASIFINNNVPFESCQYRPASEFDRTLSSRFPSPPFYVLLRVMIHYLWLSLYELCLNIPSFADFLSDIEFISPFLEFPWFFECLWTSLCCRDFGRISKIAFALLPILDQRDLIDG